MQPAEPAQVGGFVLWVLCLVDDLLHPRPMQANLSCDLTIAQALGAQRKDGGAELGFIVMAQAVDCREWFRNIECINMPSVGSYVPPKNEKFLVLPDLVVEGRELRHN